MIHSHGLPGIANHWTPRVRRTIELLWLLTVFLVPLAFATPGVMSNGFDVPRVTLYRSMVGLICALWIIEWGLMRRHPQKNLPGVSWSKIPSWLLERPTRWVVVGALFVLASSLVSTVLSSSMSVSLWGREPALDGYGIYNTISHFLLFAAVATHLETRAQVWRLFGAIIASGMVVAFYGFLQYYGLDPLGLHSAGTRFPTSLGNPLFAASFLMLVVPLSLAMMLRPQVPGIAGQHRSVGFSPNGAAVGHCPDSSPRSLVGTLAGFLVLVSISLGWRSTVRAGAVIVAAAAITWAVVSFVQPPSRVAPASLVTRPGSIAPEIAEALATDIPAAATARAGDRVSAPPE